MRPLCFFFKINALSSFQDAPKRVQCHVTSITSCDDETGVLQGGSDAAVSCHCKLRIATTKEWDRVWRGQWSWWSLGRGRERYVATWCCCHKVFTSHSDCTGLWPQIFKTTHSAPCTQHKAILFYHCCQMVLNLHFMHSGGNWTENLVLLSCTIMYTLIHTITLFTSVNCSRFLCFLMVMPGTTNISVHNHNRLTSVDINHNMNFRHVGA